MQLTCMEEKEFVFVPQTAFFAPFCVELFFWTVPHVRFSKNVEIDILLFEKYHELFHLLGGENEREVWAHGQMYGIFYGTHSFITNEGRTFRKDYHPKPVIWKSQRRDKRFWCRQTLHHLRTCLIQINKKHEKKFRQFNNKKQLRVVNTLSTGLCAIHL